MGVDTVIRLPEDVRVKDVAMVIGALLGCDTKLEQVTGHGHDPFWAARVKGVEVTPCDSLPECCNINIKGAAIGDANRWFMFHFEPEEGGRVIMPRATAVNIAMAKGLVRFFGGAVDYNDCDSKTTDYRRPKPRRKNNPGNDKPWERFQRDIASVKPITIAEVKACAKVAAYPLPDDFGKDGKASDGD